MCIVYVSLHVLSVVFINYCYYYLTRLLPPIYAGGGSAANCWLRIWRLLVLVNIEIHFR